MVGGRRCYRVVWLLAALVAGPACGRSRLTVGSWSTAVVDGPKVLSTDPLNHGVSGPWTVGGRWLACLMIETHARDSTPLPRCWLPRVRTGRSQTLPRPGCCSTRWTGRRCTRWTRSWRPRPWPRVRMARRGCRSRVRGHLWWRSSRSPSSPPPWGCRTDAGKRYVGHALELRYRLPRVWKRVQSGDLRPWLARRIAEKTLLLSMDAAGFVDRHVAPTAHRIGPVQLDRLVDEAIGRLHARPRPSAGASSDGGRPVLHRRGPAGDSFDGTLAVHGELDLADAHGARGKRSSRSPPS